MLTRILITDPSPVYCDILKKSLLAVSTKTESIQIEISVSSAPDKQNLEQADFLFLSAKEATNKNLTLLGLLSSEGALLNASEFTLPEGPNRLTELEKCGVAVYAHRPH